ncbi:hypothetical protein [Actinomadura sp. HBU206391]|uniref:hypothetical protein n=1 Tax=Actinomadura sp. HBU206391 TaxID=2731692 RepID=UPI00164F2BE6|nr:hypothetical protein [Actinomadura sp. HBU206391]MBC6456954.1 hypothetical protein [Actinomadura sp. HBU206391]
MSGLVLAGVSAASVAAAVPARAQAVAAASEEVAACRAGSRSLVPQKAGSVDLSPGQSYRTRSGACVVWTSPREVTVHEAKLVHGVPTRADTWRVHGTPTSVAYTDCVKTEVLPSRNAVFELEDAVTRIGVRTDGRQVTGIRVFPEALALAQSDLEGFAPERDMYYMPVGCDKAAMDTVAQHI